MSDLQFSIAPTLTMCADPTPLTPEEDALWIAEMDAEAKKRGFPDWESAFHLFGKPQPPKGV